MPRCNSARAGAAASTGADIPNGAKRVSWDSGGGNPSVGREFGTMRMEHANTSEPTCVMLVDTSGARCNEERSHAVRLLGECAMTTHFYRYFVCPNGHEGEEDTRETDQPYGGGWSMTDANGMVATGDDAQGPTYKCAACFLPMKEKPRT
jgi:hypothetical protein